MKLYGFFLLMALPTFALVQEICPPGYVSPKEGPACSYAQKSKSTAVTLNVLMGWSGAGDYYQGHLRNGIISSVGTVLGLTMMGVLKHFEGTWLSPQHYMLGQFFAACLILVPWTLAVASASSAQAYDGNGYALTMNGGLQLQTLLVGLPAGVEVPTTFNVRPFIFGLEYLSRTRGSYCVLVDQGDFLPIGTPMDQATVCTSIDQPHVHVTLPPGPYHLAVQVFDASGQSYGQRLAATTQVNVLTSSK